MQFMASQRIRHNLVAEQQHVKLFCDPTDCVALPGSSVHGISQARILKWVTIYFPRGIVPIQGSNLSLLYWPANSLPHGKPLSKATRSFYNPTSSIVRLQLNMNCELPDIQAGFRKGRGTRDQIANIHLIIKKAREFQKNIYFCFVDYTKAFDCLDHNKLWKILKEMGIPDHLTCLLRNLYVGQEATVRTTWNNMLAPNWERCMSRLYIVTLLI